MNQCLQNHCAPIRNPIYCDSVVTATTLCHMTLFEVIWKCHSLSLFKIPGLKNIYLRLLPYPWLRHTLHQRTLYFSEHFASQELNTLCSPTHFAKSQFTPQHPLHCYLLLKRTVCFKLACYSLLLNTLYPSAHFAYWNNFLLGTLCFQTLFAS